MNDKLGSLIRSRRFLAAVGGVLLVVGHDLLGIPQETLEPIIALIVAWIVGDSIQKTR